VSIPVETLSKPCMDLGLDRSVEDWEADPTQDEALAAALAHDDGPAAPRILAAIEAGTY
jgi:hypothetical protein